MNIAIMPARGNSRRIPNKNIKKFNGKIINIHPSLLPKYKGLNTHEKAIKNKEKYAGCTVHYVNEKLDDLVKDKDLSRYIL